MNKDSLEGGVRSTIGQGKKIVGQATDDSAMEAQRAFDYAAEKARSALGSAKEAVNQGVDTVSAVDFSGLRNEVAKLTETVSSLQKSDVEARIKKNPWGAVAIAALIGLLIGKIT